MIFVGHQIIKFLNTLPHRLRSQPRQNKDSEFKSTDIKDLDTRNLRDVQLTEYEKRKAQMKELDRYCFVVLVAGTIFCSAKYSCLP